MAMENHHQKRNVEITTRKYAKKIKHVFRI